MYYFLCDFYYIKLQYNTIQYSFNKSWQNAINKNILTYTYNQYEYLYNLSDNKKSVIELWILFN